MKPINKDQTSRWKADVTQSVDYYNDWFIKFAPQAYRDTRKQTTAQVKEAFERTRNLADITPAILKEHPSVLAMFRMATAPPIARDRLSGLAYVPSSLIKTMEVHDRVPPRVGSTKLNSILSNISEVIRHLLDRDIFTWIQHGKVPTSKDVERAATIVADRMCGAQSDPIIRNAQESRQLNAIREWLEARKYRFVSPGSGLKYNELEPGTFAFRINVPVHLESAIRSINIPVDVAIQPHSTDKGHLPIFIEAKSAGDFTNTNKRRKEEAIKMSQLKATYGNQVHYVLFLCGYFDSGYLGYEAAEGIDWIWEHRIDDMKKLLS